MQSFYPILFAFQLLFGDPAPQISTQKNIQIKLSNESGKVTQTFILNLEDPNTDILFQYEVPKEHLDYKAWAFEVIEPTQKLSYQMAFESKLPKLIHWDGYFDAKTSIQNNQKYKVRLLLIKEKNSIFASEWNEFSVVVAKERPAPLEPSRSSNVYITPTLQILMSQLKTTSLTSLFQMHYSADVRMILYNRHTLEARLETTSSTPIDFGQTDLSFYYSDMSFYYRFRILGSPNRPPSFYSIPSYIPRKFEHKKYGREFYGPPFNLEIGAKYFNTNLRGIATSLIDSEILRQSSGAAFVIKSDQQISFLRLHEGIEAGYAFISGQAMSLLGEVFLTYDQFSWLSPGMYFRYQMLTATGYSNSLMSMGLIFQLKI